MAAFLAETKDLQGVFSQTKTETLADDFELLLKLLFFKFLNQAAAKTDEMTMDSPRRLRLKMAVLLPEVLGPGQTCLDKKIQGPVNCGQRNPVAFLFKTLVDISGVAMNFALAVDFLPDKLPAASEAQSFPPEKGTEIFYPGLYFHPINLPFWILASRRCKRRRKSSS